MSLDLDPSELGFKRPFTVEVSQVLKLRNPNKEPVAFKVKTTAPKQYCVRPNSGKIEPGEATEVSVVLQPMRQDPPPDARCRDKFLVQSVAVPADEDMPPWSQLEQNYKPDIQERKIRVHYLPALGSDSPANGVDEHIDDSTMSPPPQYTPRPASKVMEETSESKGPEPSKSESSAEPGLRSVASSLRSDPSREELLERLTEANATISRLRREVDEQSLRRRKEESSSSKGVASGAVSMGVPTAEATPSGVSVQTVALLCLFVFLFTYLFL